MLQGPNLCYATRRRSYALIQSKFRLGNTQAIIPCWSLYWVLVLVFLSGYGCWSPYYRIYLWSHQSWTLYTQASICTANWGRALHFCLNSSAPVTRIRGVRLNDCLGIFRQLCHADLWDRMLLSCWTIRESCFFSERTLGLSLWRRPGL